tara:strand:+ start:2610 stop:4109 length:1500 start_codon:yes stop_codon:yes gene_type:complete
MADGTLKIFGFEITRTKDKKAIKSIVPPRDDDGAGYVSTPSYGSHYGHYINMEGDDSKDNVQLILKYRGSAMHPEADAAIEDIVNEAITSGDMKPIITLNVDRVPVSATIKRQMLDEFDNIYNMLNFKELGHDIFRRWYIDGRLYHHLVVDENNLNAGIQEIRYIDSAKIRKVKQVKKKTDPATGAKLVEKVDEFYIYQEKPGSQSGAIKLTDDSVSYVTSGLLDEHRKRVVSFLHKALKPITQLRMMEDSLVIYRLARAPERRMFYIDVGNLPRGKAEQYMKDIMAKYRNKLVYDAKTGEIRDDRKHMSMLEDFWLPRREGGRGTEISTLPGGENLGQIEDILYFQKRLYRSLNVPLNRLEQEQQFSLGRATEISRDELKFQKFIDRLRNRFSSFFYDILKKQLIMKNIITEEDWHSWKNEVNLDYTRDNHFSELKEAELLREKIQTLDQIQNYVGEYFSKQWVQKNILLFDDDEIERMDSEMAAAQQQEPEDDQGAI